jgi:hypothetical protein
MKADQISHQAPIGSTAIGDRAEDLRSWQGAPLLGDAYVGGGGVNMCVPRRRDEGGGITRHWNLPFEVCLWCTSLRPARSAWALSTGVRGSTPARIRGRQMTHRWPTDCARSQGDPIAWPSGVLGTVASDDPPEPAAQCGEALLVPHLCPVDEWL